MSIQNNLLTFATAIGNAIKPFKFIPTKPSAAGAYQLSVNASGVTSWAAPATSGASGMPYSAIWRNADQTGRSFNNPNLEFNAFPVYSSDRGNTTTFGWNINGAGGITLEANKTYVLRMTLYVTGMGSGTWCDVGFVRGTPGVYGSPVTGLLCRVYGKGFSDISCYSHEVTFRSTSAETLWTAVQNGSSTVASFTLMKGSFAIAQQVA